MIKLSLILSICCNLILISAGTAYYWRKHRASSAITVSSQKDQLRISIYQHLPRTNDKPVVFAGDSLTDYEEWSELLRQPVLNRGIFGDTIVDLGNRIDEIIQRHPRKLFLMIGTNDVLQKANIDASIEQYHSLIMRIRRETPQTHLYLQSVLPLNNNLDGTPRTIDQMNAITKLNQAIRRAAADDSIHIQYVDLYDNFKDSQGGLQKNCTLDGIHLNGVGYDKWKNAVMPLIK